MLSRRALAVFFVSMASISFEVMLTRYFAVASWSEYGYWVISIAMVGFAFSGVVLSLFRGVATRYASTLFVVLPLLIMAAAAAGYYFITINAFNPLELQNQQLWQSQLVNIGKFYLALFPYFFLTGTFLGLSFVTYHEEITKLYAADLIGAGLGAAVILGLMFFIHPFYLICSIPCILIPAAFLYAWPARGRVLIGFVGIVVLVACVTLSIAFNRARVFEFKSIYAVLHVHGNRIVEESRTPRGFYQVLDNFTERRDLAVSNNVGLMNLESPPPALGIYKDGNRLSSLIANTDDAFTYVEGALSTFPYQLRKGGRALAIGSSGGSRVFEVAKLGARQAVVLESEPFIYGLASARIAGKLPESCAYLNESPQSYLAREHEPFDVIDISEDYLDCGYANKYSLTEESLRMFFDRLTPNGVISVPVSIREFSVYAVKLVETARSALAGLGVASPETHLAVYRNEWNARVLISKSAFSEPDVAALREFCSNLSFDCSYFPGIDPASLEVWNDLPKVSFDTETVEVGGGEASDALRDDLIALLSKDRESFLAGNFFSLRPVTLDRPFLQYIFRPSRLGQLIAKIDLIPHEEIGFLVNIAVLAQATLFALIVLLAPLVRMRAVGGTAGGVLKGVVYFAALGLGFLAIEITLIEKFTFLLNDSVSAFAVVLSGMLVFSGLGSYFASRFESSPKRGLTLVALVIVGMLAVYLMFLDRIILSLLDAPYSLKIAAILGLIAPISAALGMPFSLGMSALRGRMAGFLPLAWGINGAFSVISSPLASIIAVSYGYSVVFWMALLLYPLAWLTFPGSETADE
ncbi:MAG: hypothetical protein K1Y02_24155 [Candidatus Hydrogenedentes bacterium]|nr:hypothetical protein [Candidatus Hydrogenedentota bacterium]